jgi:hypothetical protein
MDELARNMLPGQCDRRLGIDKGDRRGAICDHRDDAFGCARWREWRRHAPGAQSAEEHGRIVDAGRGDDRDGIALLNAVALQRGGDAVHQRIEAGIIELAARIGQRDLVAVFGGMDPDQVGQGGEITVEQFGGSRHGGFFRYRSRDPLGEARPKCHTRLSKRGATR